MTTLPPNAPSIDRVDDLDKVEQLFPALHLTRSSRSASRMGRVLLWVLLLGSLAALFAPWVQSIRGSGNVVAFDPYDRPQPVQALVKGLIAERGEGVVENAYVEQGQLLFRIQDQDPLFLQRLETQVELAQRDLDFAKSNLTQFNQAFEQTQRFVAFLDDELEFMVRARADAEKAQDALVEQAQAKLRSEEAKLKAANVEVWQANLDNDRQKELEAEGLASGQKQQQTQQKYEQAVAYETVAEREVDSALKGLTAKEFERAAKLGELDAKLQGLEGKLAKERSGLEKAQADIRKAEQEINGYAAKLLDAERKFEAQKTQEVVAPVAGHIQELNVFDGVSVKPGDQLCRIVPMTDDWAVQVWVDGNDQPLIQPDSKVRLQFEGWPAVQFSGWPSVAVGTFGGTVALVDPTDNGKGKFRVLIRPDEETEPWPDHPYLRQGVRANAWVLLDTVPLGYEVWRRMNGFPPALQSMENDPDKLKAPKLPKP